MTFYIFFFIIYVVQPLCIRTLIFIHIDACILPSKFFQPNQPPTLRAHETRIRKTPPSLSLSVSVSEAASMAWRGNLSKSIKELRFLFCQTSPASSHTRDFVLKNYTDLKTKNPKLPILIRECSGVQPQIWARYDMGVERCVRLDGLTAEQINAKLEELGKAG
ncbi:NADH dehydrogenase [ubiquinone] 1 alpha subcomplex subunit 2 [Rhynchospora pubera]|uniref:NADH dehydrogenase [ubiquinone] 1 alpha subcomplex subunit 2 n=1 Tax=Rhynchospora pubera TaxID=906938 RepID=A0AAV8HMG3_9POAL|nr:NADH dehydrogenase [ubiquinone] 1 alpha subcomplex subunit 2 [Rhynchospora pubera]